MKQQGLPGVTFRAPTAPATRQTRFLEFFAKIRERLFPKQFGVELAVAIGQARADLASPEECVQPRTLMGLQRAWGNRVYAARGEYLDFLGRHAREQTGRTVLDCGTGASTILLAVCAERFGFDVVALEHDPVFRRRIQRALERDVALRDLVTIHHAPLVAYESYDWYDQRGMEFSSEIGLVVCDGPPGSTRGGRYGTLPRLRQHLAMGAVVLLDDTNRAAERRILADWQREFGANYELHGPAGRFASVRI